MPFDHAPQPVVSEGKIYFGGSTDGKIYALDTATGNLEWTFFTEGPVRFAPVVWRDRLLCLSDDGFLYCLDKYSGELHWKKMGGPMVDSVLGNDRMISRWPGRGGPVLYGDLLYYGVGIWPSEGIYLYAVHPGTGEVRWLNEDAGAMEMDQPHSGARARSGISSQGYLATDGITLMVPTGRACPAAFEAKDGTFRHFRLQEHGSGRFRGAGPFVAMVNDNYVSHGHVFQTRDGSWIQGGMGTNMVVSPSQVIHVHGKLLQSLKRENFLVEREIVERMGQDKTTRWGLGEAEWTMDMGDEQAACVIQAKDILVVGTVQARVLLVDLKSREIQSSFQVDGIPLGLAVSNGYLFVSTNQGVVHGFGKVEQRNVPEIRPKMEPYRSPEKSIYAEAAREILDRTGIREGFCLDLGCGQGQLVQELAARSDLSIVAVADNEDCAREARRRLDAQGVYGKRITVLNRSLEKTGLPNMFADLVVSSDSLEQGTDAFALAEAKRLLRPYGGVLITGRPGAMDLESRGELEGAGTWTHQYGDPGNLGCSDDQILAGPLGMLWFRDNEWEMPCRHGRGPSPVFSRGVLVVEGLHGLQALNAYNGRILWTYARENILKPFDQEHLNGVAITGSNLCVEGESLYIRQEDRCERLDLFTGEKQDEYRAPMGPNGKPGLWGYLAVREGVLLGSLYDPTHVVTYAYGKSDMSELFSESILLFAMDAGTGRVLWEYRPQHSIRNNAISWGKGRVFLIDRPLAIRDRQKEDQTFHPKGALLALDETSGEVFWKGEEPAFGTMLLFSESSDVLLMAYQATRFRLNSELGGRMRAYQGSTGQVLWDIEADYRSRPLINDRTIYAQPGAWDLLTGRPLDFRFSRSYGCGILSASRRLLAYRSATLGFWDLEVQRGDEHYGGIRPGCWINAIPAGGLLLMPEASNRCVCSYLIKATVALQPHGIRCPMVSPPPGMYSEPVTVTLSTEEPRVQIRYTLDGTSPDEQSLLYEKPILVRDSMTVKARAFQEGTRPSSLMESVFLISRQ